MVFSGVPFLFVFLPVTFLLYSLLSLVPVQALRQRLQNGLLVVCSLLFYAYGEPVYVILMVASVFVNYLLTIWMDRSHGRQKKVLLAVDVICNLLVIGIFKYAGFIMTQVNTIFHCKFIVPQIPLPIGISFFTFQVMSYCIDVYRGDAKAATNYGRLLLYVSFFPQLIAGPIVKYKDVERFISSRQQSWDEAAIGLRRFIFGLSKKLFLANSCGSVADAMFALTAAETTAASAWLGGLCYLFQIYFDFSGYSDMAIGLGHMFGFTFLENFDHPYCSCSIREFWRRWHISLSTWFKEYLYIPLGGNRNGKLRTMRNKWIVFFCTGLWHGAAWTFVLWGLLHGAAIVLEELLDVPKRNIPKPIGWAYTTLVALFAFVLFRAESLGQGADMMAAMLGFGGSFGKISLAASQAISTALTPYAICMITLAGLFAFPVLPKLTERLKRQEKIAGAAAPLSYIAALVLLALCCMEVASATYNPFIYFRF